jgi:hypothetical protein
MSAIAGRPDRAAFGSRNSPYTGARDQRTDGRGWPVLPRTPPALDRAVSASCDAASQQQAIPVTLCYT